MRRLLRAEDGQAVVELALALPILMVVVLGIVDFGKAVNYWNDENHIANLTARYAAVGRLPEYGECGKLATPAAFAECEAKIDSPELAGGSKRTTGAQGKLVVCVSIPKATVGEPVEVKITTSYSWLKLPKVLGGNFKFISTNLSGRATMRLEQVPPSGFATTTGKC
jgi:Flp pilus assembly protein TadG